MDKAAHPNYREPYHESKNRETSAAADALYTDVGMVIVIGINENMEANRNVA